MVLPPEIRNRIAELTLYHGKDGIISPGPRTHADHYVTLVESLRITGTMVASARATFGTPFQLPLDEGMREFILEHTTTQQCFKGCLFPPPLTRVCRQLRTETLSLFYGVNHFHFELSQFLILDAKGRSIGPGVGDWLGQWKIVACDPFESSAWRSRWMKFVFSCPRRCSLRLQKPMGRAGGEVAIKKVNFPQNTTPEDDKIDCMTYFESCSRKPFHGALRGSGLHVRALECLIASFEQPDVYLPRDYIALQVSTLVGKVAGRYEEISGFDGELGLEDEDVDMRDYTELLDHRLAKMEEFGAAARRRR